jgi:hypothetical protein
MIQQRQLNQHADALYNGDAAPSLIDIVALQDAKQDVYIPRTFAQLRYLIERAEALWVVLLGSQHAVTQQYHTYKQYLGTYEHRLERIVPLNPQMRYLTPALLARRVQLATNAWLVGQARTAMPIPFTGLTDIFHDIDLGKQWEAPFPAQYIASPVPPSVAPTRNLAGPAPSVVSVGGSTGNTTAASTLTTPTATTTPATAAPSATPNAIVRNMAYNAAVFEVYKAMNIKAKVLKEQLRTRGVAYPTNAHQNNMCLTYHVQGICNTNCRNASDHYAHTPAEDETFRSWCEQHYKLDA